MTGAAPIRIVFYRGRQRDPWLAATDQGLQGNPQATCQRVGGAELAIT
jgi:hypothetical protein